MSCCASGTGHARNGIVPSSSDAHGEELLLASRAIPGGLRRTELSVPEIHCGGCIRAIEKALGGLPGVDTARVNLSTKRVTVCWRGSTAPPLIETLAREGYRAHLHDPGMEEKDRAFSELLRALAVAGFAAMNIMLLSVSVWSGADAATRDLFHWISAAIACPTLIYSGRIFFRSAWSALRHGRTNMDVPISIGVILAFALSLYETVHHGQHAYFDASVTLLFFLLIGRTLDHMMRKRARSAISGLARLAARGATILREDGTRDYLPVDAIEPGTTILLMAGDRVPVDARVEAGRSDIDCSLVTGESEPRRIGPGSDLQAGTLNLTGALTVTATATAQNSFLAEMMRLMEVAEHSRSTYLRLADRVSRLYAPAVHLAALFAFAGWIIATGNLHLAVTIAVAVLIITCPCALGLAVPMVQVAAARRLFELGIMAREGSAMERLNEIDTVVFDKTGTLTLDGLRLANAADIEPAHLALAAAIGRQSRHPHSQALAVNAHPDDQGMEFDSIHEHPGLGVEARAGATMYRLGRAEWVLGGDTVPDFAGPATVLSTDGRLTAVFHFHDQLRPGAGEAVADLKRMGLSVEVISGDRPAAVRRVADALGIPRFAADALPGGKTARLAELAGSGRKVLMVGDGLNDAPALAAAHVSIAPASAADIGRNAADFVFLHDSLDAVPRAIAVSRDAGALIRQNIGLAILYNVIALPLAVFGFVTPLVAALAMSGSSIVVVANALRLGSARPARHTGQVSISGIGRSALIEPAE